MSSPCAKQGDEPKPCMSCGSSRSLETMMSLQQEKVEVTLKLLKIEKQDLRRAAQYQEHYVEMLNSAHQSEKRKYEQELEQLRGQLQEEQANMKEKDLQHQQQMESLEATHLLKLEEVNDKANQLALKLEQLQQETRKEEDKADNLNVQQLSVLKDQIDRLQKSQQTFLELDKVETRKLNEIINSLTQKQRQVFDVKLPIQDAKVNAFEKQIDELNQVELAAATAVASRPVPNPSLGAADDCDGDTRNNHRMFDRRPPLTQEDSHRNQHVEEHNLVIDEKVCKYTGFLNAMKMPNGHGRLLRVDNGDVYVGEWKNGQRHGLGVYNGNNGDLYTGAWFEGKRHGHGVFIFTDGRVYDGQYNMGLREGQGMFVWPRGAMYAGSFHADKRNGYGEYVYPDGRSYQGEYRDDRPHGYGVEKSKDGTVLYDGQWIFGEFLGNDDCVIVAASIAH